MSRVAALAVLAVLAISPRASAVYQCGDQTDTCQCGANNPYPCCDNGGNCTWYAWEAACCGWGVGLPGWGNANQWAGNAAANASYQVLPYPVVNAVSCKADGSYGHVAYVVGLNGGGDITVHEENCWGNYGMDSQVYAASFFTGGFIVRAGQAVCKPGDSQTQSCGNCGTQSRGCSDTGAWEDWGACSSEGACTPGATDSAACGTCGTHERSCTTACQWNSWSTCEGADPVDAASCDAGLLSACTVAELRCSGGNLTCETVVERGCSPDAGHPDAGHSDGGHADAGPSDGGHSDAGALAEPPSHEEPRAPHPHGGCTAADGGSLSLLLVLLGGGRRRATARSSASGLRGARLRQ